MKANQCHWCGKFAKYEEMDSYTPFGCSNPASPEPYDPTFICGECSDILYKQFMNSFTSGGKNGHWQKSDAEIKAAKDSGLVWIHSNSIMINGKRVLYQYVNKNELINSQKEKR